MNYIQFYRHIRNQYFLVRLHNIFLMVTGEFLYSKNQQIFCIQILKCYKLHYKISVHFVKQLRVNKSKNVYTEESKADGASKWLTAQQSSAKNWVIRHILLEMWVKIANITHSEEQGLVVFLYPLKGKCNLELFVNLRVLNEWIKTTHM